jgi:heme/copper-type cytochrome/quinol oxidase subunit 3
MTTKQNLLEQGMTRAEIQALRNKRTGLLIFQISWIMAFICLIFVNMQLRSQSGEWPPPGVEKLTPILPSAMTVALIVSSLFARRAVKAIKADDAAAFLKYWRYVIGLGALFVLGMGAEWAFVPVSGQYSNVFRLMVGFHVVHALAIAYYLWRVYRGGLNGVYNRINFWPVEGGAGLWHFVTVAWLLFFIVLYVV